MNTPASNSLYAISQWGKMHKWPARFVLTIGHVVLAGSAVVAGAALLPYAPFAQGIIQAVLLLLAGGIALLYAKKRRSKGHAGWTIRKKGEGAFLLCGVLLLLLSGPALREDKVRFGMAPAFAISHNAPAKKEQTKVGRFLSKLKKRYVEMSVAGKILLAALLVALTLGAVVGLTVMACDLACSGYEVASFLVGGVGVVGVITLCVFGLLRLLESKERMLERQSRKSYNKGYDD